ncbi:MAG: RibD family protein [Limisphaerales bacterium]
MNSKSKIKNQKSKLPFVFSNFVMTADGKIAFANGKFIPFGSRRDREHMMELRATADAVMAGARTIEQSRAMLGTGSVSYRRLRLKRGLSEYNLRVIVSRFGAIDRHAEIFKHDFSPIIILTTGQISKKILKELGALVAEIKICGERDIDFRAALTWLREKWNVKSLLCEGGGELHGGLIRASLMDEIHLTICPKIFGGRNAPTIAEGKGILNLADMAQFKLKSMKQIGDELFTVFARKIGENNWE